ncbi:MAG: hydroxylamine reductase [Anaerovoracaceae bacterium]|jgi:hydroxylamine reductase
MYCYQCEQTACQTACEGEKGVCGKDDRVAQLQDQLTGACIGLARSVAGQETTEKMDRAVISALFMTMTNVNFDPTALQRQFNMVRDINRTLPLEYDINELWSCPDPDVKSAKSLILFGIRGMAAYAFHALALRKDDQDVMAFFFKALRAIGSDMKAEDLLPLVMETGEKNLICMELLDKANTEAYGQPVPTEVSTTIEPGPFVVVSGHDLRDLELLLNQTWGYNINVYTHGEMLPAHAYPGLKKFPHLKGHFGTAWQNQQTEFDGMPAPVLFTSNCLMPPKPSYSDRVFTSGPVAYKGMFHIFDDKDFSAVAETAIMLGGYPDEQKMTGINGGSILTTGFAHDAILSKADAIVDAVKAGKISHFFLVGGCDGAKPGRNYFTELVKKTPQDSVIMTLACGKFRFNDLDLGTVAGLPRLMDLGQCNDAFSAIKVASALAEAFDCGLNDLPLSLVLSWYEQKAVAVLLTLLHLGMKNIYLGPTLPAFISPNVMDFLVSEYGIHATGDADEDLREMLK